MTTVSQNSHAKSGFGARAAKKLRRGGPPAVIARCCFFGHEQQVELGCRIVERTAAQADDVGKSEAVLAQESHDALDFGAPLHRRDRAGLYDQGIDFGKPAGLKLKGGARFARRDPAWLC